MLIPFEKTVASSYKYARILDKEVGFYKTTLESTPLFFLPYSYYVKIIEKGEVFSKVECFGESSLAPCLEGFVLNEFLVEEEYLETFSPYLSFSIETISTAPLYEDLSLTKISKYIFEDRKLNYYGYNQINGEYLYFVEYNGKLGFVREESIKPFTLPLHEKPIDLPVSNPQDEEIKNENNNTLSIIILVLTFILIAGVIVYLFVPKKQQKHLSYYDENEFLD